MAADVRADTIPEATHLKKPRARHLIVSGKYVPFIPSPRRLRYISYICIAVCILLTFRQLRLVVNISHPSVIHANPQSPPHPANALRPFDDSDVSFNDDSGLPKLSETSINLWRRVEHDCPLEKDPPDAVLYGTGKERCFSLGLPDTQNHVPEKGEPAAFWQMNSRAFCYSEKPVCLGGRSLENLYSFEERGSGTCSVVAVEKGEVHPAGRHGLNESCAAWRKRQVVSMHGGNEHFWNYKKWEGWVERLRGKKENRSRANVDPVKWESEFAIVVPKYAWSYNICHYNRIWNLIMYIIRNLHLFVPDADKIDTIDIQFRSGFNYKGNWHVGIRNATLRALIGETGKKISVGKMRYDYERNFQCIKRGILLGREGRVDAFPFFNDTAFWRAEDQIKDNHWPVIPHDSLWLRESVSRSSGLGSVGNYTGPGVKNFESIPVPPRRVGILQRSPRSRRRLSPEGKSFFEMALINLCEKYDLEIVKVRTSGNMSLGQQVAKVQRLGMAVGLHGANMVNSMFIPAGGALFEIFPWRYVRYYYAGGGNTGLRYSFHEPEKGLDRNCSFSKNTCFMQYRESLILLSKRDEKRIYSRLDKSMRYLDWLHRRYPEGHIPLTRVGNVYHFK